MNRRDRRLAKKAARKGAGGIAMAPPDIRQRFQQAVALFQQGNPAAETLLRGIEADAGGIPEVSHLLGVVLLRTGRAAEAIAPLDDAAKGLPRDPAPANLLGVACHQAGDRDAAFAAFRKALARNPDFADAHFNFGNALREAGRDAEAVEHFRAATRLEPDFADAHYNLGLAEAQRGHFAAAIEAYGKALALTPGQADAHIGLSRALTMLHRNAEGEAAARAALALAPDAMEAHSNLARALQGQGRMADAEAAMRAAIARAPDTASLYANLGNILEDQDKVAAAEAAYRDAIARDPGFAAAHTNLGLLLLLNRRDEEGWREYDWRWRCAGRALRPFPQPRWTGDDPAGRTILAWGDEGPGDEILFASLLPDLVARAGKVVVECEPRLAGLFARAFPAAEVHPRRDPPVRRLLAADIDAQTPFTELARRLRPNLAEASSPARPHLAADPALAAACRARYRALGDGLIVGIAWASGNLLRPDRNAPLPLWDPVLTLPGLRFVSLQYGDRGAEIAEVRERLDIDIHVDPHIDQFASLEQFAAQVDAVDIVVSITNTTVHMAGALGKTVWTMLPYMPDWRYRREPTDTPWYPAMRLFRQTKARRWDDVMARVAAALAAFRDERLA
jgi:tetratricopeptide (TPR) repeat protein